MYAAGFIEQYFQDVCVPIQGECDTGSSSEFFINGQLTLWPDPPTQQYNITYSPTSRAYSFCFTNTTAPITIAEYCHQDHSAGCSLCSVQSGELVFQTRSEILIFSPLPGMQSINMQFGTKSLRVNKLLIKINILLCSSSRKHWGIPHIVKICCEPLRHYYSLNDCNIL